MLPGVTGPRPCLAVVRDGRIRTQSPILNSSTLSISAGSAFQPREAPGKPTLRIPSSSIHSTVPMLSCDCPCHPYLHAKQKIASLYLERSQSHITAHCEKIQKRFFKPNTKKTQIIYLGSLTSAFKRTCWPRSRGTTLRISSASTRASPVQKDMMTWSTPSTLCTKPTLWSFAPCHPNLGTFTHLRNFTQSPTSNLSDNQTPPNWSKNTRLSPMSENKNTSSNCLIAILQILLKITEQTNTPISKGPLTW